MISIRKRIFGKKELAHDRYFSALRHKEYRRLAKQKHIYLDYTGGNLYAASQLVAHTNLLESAVLGNPHSTNPTSQLATELVAEARASVIEFFNANDYYCIFTQNASSALKIVGECYPFGNQGHFLLFADNHNSVNGIREYCAQAGGQYSYVPMNDFDLTVSEEVLIEKLSGINHKNKLLAYPAQSNVSGTKHSLDWIKRAKRLGWDVLLDAAAFVPTSPLDLEQHQPDFVSVSFYKIFGYPTGMGCLLVKKSAFPKLQKKWFAGGTVNLASVKAAYHFLADSHERFENGTINYLDIPAIKIGLDYVTNIGMRRINERITSLTTYLHRQLVALTHSNGKAQLEVFGSPTRENMGGTLMIAFKNPDGSKIGFKKIESLSSAQNISIRSGCFCNPGLDEINNDLTVNEITHYFSNRQTGNYEDMVGALRKMRGATRVSVGIATNQNDLDTFVTFAKGLKDKILT